MTPRRFTEADYRARRDFRSALRRFLVVTEQAARDEGVTPAHHQLLLAIRGHHDGRPTTSDVADTLQVRLHSATELVDRAIAKGLVDRRHSDPTDARRAVLQLTDLGQQKLDAVMQRHRDELRRFRDLVGETLGDID